MKHTIVGIFLSGLLVLAGCSGVMTAPDNGTSPQDGSAGNLTVRIGYPPSPGRTAYPSHDGTTPLEYKLEFAWAGGGTATPTHDDVSISPGVPASIRLETGSWTVTAKAKAGGVEKASGSDTVTVTASGVAVTIALNPVGDPVPTTGTLGYVLYFPAGITGSLSLADAGGSPAGSETAFTSGTEGSIPNLAPGSYLATVILTNGTIAAGRTEAIHIVAGLITKVAYNFYEDFASAPTPVTSDTDLAKIGVDSGWPLSGRYVLANDITLADWTPLGSLEDPFTGSFDGGGNTITINSFSAAALADNQYIGVFAAAKGLPEHKARVKNLSIASSVSIAAMSTTLGQGIGLVSGYAEDAVISGVNFSGHLNIEGVTKITFAGGAVGDMRKGAELRDCASAMNLSVISTVTGAMTGDPPYPGAATAIGGLAGFFLTGTDGAEYGEGKDALIKNCANSNDVTVSYATTGAVAAGGIVGGLTATSANHYLGRIEDCAYTGNLSSSCGGGYSGGIAGAIGGNGGDSANEANTSRILRCRTVGNIGGAQRTGGIVGSATYGALVAQCSSDVTIGVSGNYAGGIVGTLNQQARISDCWSGGTVRGNNYAAGIGCLESAAVIQRCYSRTAVSISISSGVASTTLVLGGILGGGTSTSATVTKCVALNESLNEAWSSNSSAAFNRVRRIWSGPMNDNITSGSTMNYAVTIPIVILTGPSLGGSYTLTMPRDGVTLEDNPPEQWLYEVTLGWDFDEVWTMGSDGYPRLRGVDEGY